MNPQDLLDKALVIIKAHLDQIHVQATTMTKDGAKGFTDSNSQVVDRYAKILLTMTKKNDNAVDEFDNMTDEELQEAARTVLGDNNANETSQ